MRKFLFALCLVAVAVLPVAAQDAAAVVKKAIEAHGGTDALNKAKIAKTTGKGTITMPDGQKVEYVSTAIYSLPDKYKLEIVGELAKLKLVTTQVLNGKKVKMRAVLGGMENPLPEKAKDETIQAALVQEVSLLTPLVAEKKYTLKADKDADVNGKPAAVVVVSGNSLREVKLFFDKGNNQLVKMQRKAFGPAGGEVDEETYLADFKKVESALLPGKVVVHHNKKEFMTIAADWKFLDKVEASEFAIDD